MAAGTGRKKILMKRNENPNNRKVTFTKRRQGLFKKAHELRQITNCKIFILVLSTATNPNPFIFGAEDLSLLESACGDHAPTTTTTPGVDFVASDDVGDSLVEERSELSSWVGESGSGSGGGALVTDDDDDRLMNSIQFDDDSAICGISSEVGLFDIPESSDLDGCESFNFDGSVAEEDTQDMKI